MGKQGRPWRAGSEQQQPSRKQWEYWRGSRPSPRPAKEAKPNLPVFPAYDAIPGDASGITEIRETRSLAGQKTNQSLVQLAQAAVNHTRKLDAKAVRLEKDLKAKQQFWLRYVAGMRQSYRNERARHVQDCARLEAELREAVEQQQAAHQQLGAIVPQIQMASEEPDDWDQVMTVIEPERAEGTNPLQELGKFLSARQFASGAQAPLPGPGMATAAAPPGPAPATPITPPHRPHFGVSETPPSTARAVRDPYIGSPNPVSMSGVATGGTETAERNATVEGDGKPPSPRKPLSPHTGQRPIGQARKPTSQEQPRKTIKEASKGTGTAQDAQTGKSLGSKLEERRQQELAAAFPAGAPPGLAPPQEELPGNPGVDKIPVNIVDDDIDELDEAAIFGEDGELKQME